MDLEHTLLKLGAAALAAAFWQKVAFWAVLGLAGTWIGIPAAPPLGHPHPPRAHPADNGSLSHFVL